MDIDKYKDKILGWFKQWFDMNYRSGVPRIPPHTHNGIDNLQIPVKNLIGDNVTKIKAGTNVTITPITGLGEVTVNASGGGGGGGGTPGGFPNDVQLQDFSSGFTAVSSSGQDDVNGFNHHTQVTPGFYVYSVYNMGGFTFRGDTGLIENHGVGIGITISVGSVSLQPSFGYLGPPTNVGPASLNLNVSNADATNGLSLSSDGYGVNLNDYTTYLSGDGFVNTDYTFYGVSVTGTYAYTDNTYTTIHPVGGNIYIGGGYYTGAYTIGEIPDSTLINNASLVSVTNSIVLKESTSPTGTVIDGQGNGAGVLYIEGGALKFQGGSGTITTIAPA
jgi:hypothetical protein